MLDRRDPGRDASTATRSGLALARAARGRGPAPRAGDDLAQGRRLVDRPARPDGRRTRATPARAIRDRAGRAAGAGGRVGATDRGAATAADSRASVPRPLGARPRSRHRARLARAAPSGPCPPRRPRPPTPTSRSSPTPTYTVQPTHAPRPRRRGDHRPQPPRRDARRTSSTSTTRSSPSSRAPAGSRSPARKGATGRGGRSDRRTRPLLRIDFGARLYERQGGHATSSRSTSSTRASRPNRAGPGRHGLVTLPVWAFASDGASGSTRQVRFPAGYDVAVESGVFDSRAGRPTAARCSRPEPLAQAARLLRLRLGPAPGDLQETPLDRPGGRRQVDLVVRGWRDDPAWAERDRRPAHPRPSRCSATEIGAPVAARRADRRPGGRRAATAGGYAGLFDPAEPRIEVAYWADRAGRPPRGRARLVQRRPVADRWASEGFASLYAQRAAATLSSATRARRCTDALERAAIPLNAGVPRGETPRATPRRADRVRHRGIRLRGLARARAARSPSGPGTRRCARSGPPPPRTSAPTSPAGRGVRHG